MTEKEKNLRVEIMHLREELLISENQIFNRIFKLIKRKNNTSTGSLNQSNSLQILLNYKNKLERLKSSPFMLVVISVNVFSGIITMPAKIMNKLLLKYEFLNQTKKKSQSCDIINFGVIPYDFRKLRQQHLVEELAKLNHRVFYIENRFHVQKKFKPGYTIYKKHDNVYIVKLNSLRDIAIYHQRARTKEIKSINMSLQKLINDVQINTPLMKIDHPFWTYLLPHLNNHVIYDCMDDYAGFDITGKHILSLEKTLIKKADLTVVCSEILMNKINKYHPKRTMLIKNACEYEHFAKARNSNRTNTIGFFGALGEWIDDELLGQIAQKFQNFKIILIGDVQNEKIKLVANKYHNIQLIGELPYSKLPKFLRNFDVCIIPFRITAHTTLIDPVKMYEYFAAGKPVVTTAVQEIKKFSKYLYYSDTKKDFIHSILLASKEKSSKKINIRQEIAQKNTWEKRTLVLNKEINKLKKMIYNREII